MALEQDWAVCMAHPYVAETPSVAYHPRVHSSLMLRLKKDRLYSSNILPSSSGYPLPIINNKKAKATQVPPMYPHIHLRGCRGTRGRK